MFVDGFAGDGDHENDVFACAEGPRVSSFANQDTAPNTLVDRRSAQLFVGCFTQAEPTW
jgi:hypothetical protein